MCICSSKCHDSERMLDMQCTPGLPCVVAMIDRSDDRRREVYACDMSASQCVLPRQREECVPRPSECENATVGLCEHNTQFLDFVQGVSKKSCATDIRCASDLLSDVLSLNEMSVMSDS